MHRRRADIRGLTLSCERSHSGQNGAMSASILWEEPTGQGWTQVGELTTALVLSSAIGLEREIRQKAAGLRTYTIIGLGAALFMLVSKYGFTDVLRPGLVAARPLAGRGADRLRTRLHRRRRDLHAPRQRPRPDHRGRDVADRRRRRGGGRRPGTARVAHDGRVFRGVLRIAPADPLDARTAHSAGDLPHRVPRRQRATPHILDICTGAGFFVASFSGTGHEERDETQREPGTGRTRWRSTHAAGRGNANTLTERWSTTLGDRHRRVRPRNDDEYSLASPHGSVELWRALGSGSRRPPAPPLRSAAPRPWLEPSDARGSGAGRSPCISWARSRRTVAWESRWVRWPDFRLPADRAAAREWLRGGLATLRDGTCRGRVRRRSWTDRDGVGVYRSTRWYPPECRGRLRAGALLSPCRGDALAAAVRRGLPVMRAAGGGPDNDPPPAAFSGRDAREG